MTAAETRRPGTRARPAPTRVALWLLLPLAVVVAQLVFYAPRLPERVASHFDGAGNPDGWMGRGAFLWTMGAIAVGLAVMIALTIWLLPKLPTSLVNMPHREYWLAEPRRADSYRALAVHLVGHGAVTLALLGYLLHETYRVNTQPEAVAMSVWGPLVAYLVVTGLLIVLLLRRFARVPVGAPSE